MKVWDRPETWSLFPPRAAWCLLSWTWPGHGWIYEQGARPISEWNAEKGRVPDVFDIRYEGVSTCDADHWLQGAWQESVGQFRPYRRLLILLGAFEKR